MRRSGKLLVEALLCLGLSGCALMKLGGGKAPATYDLVAPEHVSRHGRRIDRQIVVTEPGAVRALAGDRILVRPAPVKIAYYGGAVWADRLPRLLQARIVETLQRSGRFRAVSDGSDRTEADLQLATTIRIFHVEVAGKRATASIALLLKLIDESGGRTLASRQFVARVPAAENNIAAGIEALNAALRNILPRIARWVGRSSLVRGVSEGLRAPRRSASQRPPPPPPA